MKRWERGRALPRRVAWLLRLSGPLLTLTVVASVQVLTELELPVSNLGLILLAPVVYSVLVGGTAWGLASMVVALAYYAYYVSPQGGMFPDYTVVEAERLVTTVLVTPFVVSSLGMLKTRLDELLVRERALRASAEAGQRGLSTMLERITDGFIAVDCEWHYTFVNVRAEQMIGKRSQDLLGRTIWEAFPDLEGTFLEDEYRRALEEEVSVRFELYYAPLRTWFEIRAYPSSDGLSLFLADVTPQREATDALATRLRQQAAVAQLGQDALRGTGTDVLLSAAARHVAEGLGVELAEVLEARPDEDQLLLVAGVGWRPNLVGRARVETETASQAGYTLAAGAPVVVEDTATETRFSSPALLCDHGVVSGITVVIHGTGERPFGLLGAHTRERRSFTRDDANFMQSVANVLGDTIERQRIREVLRASEAERARALGTEKAARAAAEAAVRARDDILAVVSHDLRSPLSTIAMGTELLHEAIAEPRLARRVEMVQRAVRQMSRLIEDLLTVAKIDTGGFSIVPAPVDSTGMIDEVVEALRPDAKHHELVLAAGTACDLPPVYADRGRVLQALSNLIGNAMKFTGPGGHITVRAREASREVVFSVEDTGSGIPSEQLPHLFDRFWQANADRRGAGLGLTITKGIVEAHGGRIWVESRLNEGSSFYFSLPTSEPPSSTREPRRADRSSSDVPSDARLEPR